MLWEFPVTTDVVEAVEIFEAFSCYCYALVVVKVDLNWVESDAALKLLASAVGAVHIGWILVSPMPKCILGSLHAVYGQQQQIRRRRLGYCVRARDGGAICVVSGLAHLSSQHGLSIGIAIPSLYSAYVLRLQGKLRQTIYEQHRSTHARNNYDKEPDDATTRLRIRL